jgi:hypothetical protein
MLDASLLCSCFQRLGRLGREVAVVLVHVDACADPVGVEFGVKLSRVDVVADTEGLDGAVCRVGQTDQIRGQRAGALLMAPVRIEDLGQLCDSGSRRPSSVRVMVMAPTGSG